MDVIDFGCGEGTDIFTLNLLTPKNKKVNFTGLDFSKVVIDFANEVAKKRGANNCKFVVGDADSVRFVEKKFDLLISSEVLEHTSYPLVYLHNANEQLHIGGKIIMTTPNQSHLFKRMFRFMPMSIRKNIIKEQNWCYERHGIDTTNLFHSHVSTQTYNQLKILFKKSGFKIIRATRSPLIYGGNWIDKRPLLFSMLLFLDGIIPKRWFINLGWELLIFAEKIKHSNAK